MDELQLSPPELLRLATCSQEPIRTPGNIQPHGALLAFDRESRRLILASENVDHFVGAPAAQLLGRTAEEIFAESTIAALVDAAGGANPARVTLNGQALDAIVNRGSTISLVELETASSANNELENASAVYGSAHRLSALRDRDELLARAAVEFSNLTGFDRVMVYQFHDDDHGEVVAEVAAEGMEPYLGLHFPSTDIPSQARALYLTKLSRAIVSTTAAPVGLVALDGSESIDFDLSHAELRAVSPLHLQFMRNMGQASTVSFSLVHEGRLAGMITCAHRSERRLPFLLRRSLEVLANQVALQWGAAAEIAKLGRDVSKRELRSSLLSRMLGSDILAAALLSDENVVRQLIPAEAVAVRLDSVVRTTAGAPSTAALDALAAVIDEQPGRQAFSSDALAERHPELSRLMPDVAGALVVRVGADGDYLAFFRSEVAQQVRWLGNPDESNRATPLSPRTSFSAWTQSVTGRSEAWGPAVSDALEFARDLEGALTRRAEARLASLALRDPLTGLSNRRYLIDELTHLIAQNAELSLLFIDLDKFKSVNDTHGHDAGDAVLTEVAHRLAAQTRNRDRVARLGGDEFVVLCEMPPSDAATVASRIIASIAEPIAIRDGSVSLTASCGIVNATPESTPAALLERADAAMYRAKNGGRNQVSD